MVEHGGANLQIHGNARNNRPIPGETVVSDAVEHPIELELESRHNLQEHEAEGEAVYKFQFDDEMDPLTRKIPIELELESRHNLQEHEAVYKFQFEDEMDPLTRKIGDATIHYAQGRFEEAICLLKEVICLAPNLTDSYYTLGRIYTTIGDKKRALNFYMMAAHLNPNDAPLWKLLVTRSIEEGDIRQANYCLSKAIMADPEDIGLWLHRASLYVELREYQKAADSYEQISRLRPDNIEVLEKSMQLYKKCGQHERAISMLEDSIKNHGNIANLSVVDILTSVLMERNEYARALEHIECTQQACGTRKEIPLYLTIKAGICHVHLGRLEKAEAYFNVLRPEDTSAHPHLIIDVADALMTVGYHGYLYLKIARCYVSLGKRVQAIEYCHNGNRRIEKLMSVKKLDDSSDARLMLSSLLLEENRDDEAIYVLPAPLEPESALDAKSGTYI